MKRKQKPKVENRKGEKSAPFAAIILVAVLAVLSWPCTPSGEPLGWLLLLLDGGIALRFLWAWFRGELTNALIWIYGLVFAVCVLVVTWIYQS